MVIVGVSLSLNYNFLTRSSLLPVLRRQNRSNHATTLSESNANLAQRYLQYDLTVTP